MKHNKQNQKTQKTCAKLSAKFLDTLSPVFFDVLCGGTWYEPKMPQRPKK